MASRPQGGLVTYTKLRSGALPAAEQPRVILVQALAKHVEQLVALPDDLREETIARYPRLYVACGCHTARELTSWLATERKTRRCPIARFLRVCGQLGLEARLPACLSLGKVERERDELVRASRANPHTCLGARCVGGSKGRRGASRQIVGCHTTPPARPGDAPA